jgi:hypothetical protein
LESLAAPSVCVAAGASPLGGEAGLVSEQHPVPPIATAELDRATGASGLSAELVEPKAGRSATSADQATEDVQNRVLARRSEDQPARRSESGGAQRQLMQLAAAYIPPPPRNKPRPARSAFSPGPASLRLPLSTTFSGVSAVRRALSRFFSRLCSRQASFDALVFCHTATIRWARYRCESFVRRGAMRRREEARADWWI